MRIGSDERRQPQQAMQILDDAHEKYAKLKPYQYGASLYAIVPANPRVTRTPGKWNQLEIDCKGDSYRIVHNGVEVVNADADKVAELKQRLKSGHLGLQNHRQVVSFRRLRIGPSLQQ